MFTGIVSFMGVVRAVGRRGRGFRLVVAARNLGRVPRGVSVAVNGTCLTAVRGARGILAADLSPETLARTTLGGLAVGVGVNLERPLRAGAEIGGHFVAGHVDGVGTVTAVRRAGDGRRIAIRPPRALLRFIALKGSVTVEGVSLTVAGRRGGTFEVALIPHTLAVTTLGRLRRNARVNLEADLLARYLGALRARRRR